MNILFLSNYYYPHFGGVETHLKNLNKVLVKNNKISVITTKFDSVIKNYAVVDRVKVYRVQYPKLKFFGLIFIWLGLIKYINLIKKADIIHCHDVFIWYLPFRFLFPRKKVFITFHGYESYPIRFTAKIIRKISEVLSDGNICIGEFMKKWYYTNSTYISYGAVDLKKFKSKNTKIKYDACFAGRFDNQTAILKYAKVVEILRKKIKFKFIALGDGEYMDKVSKVVITPGWVDDPSKYMKESRFVFADRYLAILEAFAARKLVFAMYDNPIKKDYLRMTPYKDWIVISNSPEEIARKVLYYSKHKKEANEKIEKAYRWVKNKNWVCMANLYRSLWTID